MSSFLLAAGVSRSIVRGTYGPMIFVQKRAPRPPTTAAATSRRGLITWVTWSTRLWHWVYLFDTLKLAGCSEWPTSSSYLLERIASKSWMVTNLRHWNNFAAVGQGFWLRWTAEASWRIHASPGRNTRSPSVSSGLGELPSRCTSELKLHFKGNIPTVDNATLPFHFFLVHKTET